MPSIKNAQTPTQLAFALLGLIPLALPALAVLVVVTMLAMGIAFLLSQANATGVAYLLPVAVVAVGFWLAFARLDRTIAKL